MLYYIYVLLLLYMQTISLLLITLLVPQTSFVSPKTDNELYICISLLQALHLTHHTLQLRLLLQLVVLRISLTSEQMMTLFSTRLSTYTTAVHFRMLSVLDAHTHLERIEHTFTSTTGRTRTEPCTWHLHHVQVLAQQPDVLQLFHGLYGSRGHHGKGKDKKEMGIISTS